MVKYNLHKMSYSTEERLPKKTIITTVWVILTAVIVMGTMLTVNGILREDGEKLNEMRAASRAYGSNPLIGIVDEIGIMGYFILLITMIVVYFALKLAMTLLFCSDKRHSTNLKFLEEKALPICACREAFTVQQIAVMYCVPIFITYVLLLALCILAMASPEIMIILFFLGFFMAFDLTLIIFVLCIKIKDKIDYISVDAHVYELTLFKRSDIGAISQLK